MPRASTLRQQRQVEKAINPPEQGDNFQPTKLPIYLLYTRKLIYAKLNAFHSKFTVLDKYCRYVF